MRGTMSQRWTPPWGIVNVEGGASTGATSRNLMHDSCSWGGRLMGVTLVTLDRNQDSLVRSGRIDFGLRLHVAKRLLHVGTETGSVHTRHPLTRQTSE